MDDTVLELSPLDAVHRRLGAKMGAFSGWDMPVAYAGTLSEHEAVRSAVGVFDVSHLGKVSVNGDGAREVLQHALSNDLDALAVAGAAQYTLCLTDEGTITDDLIVYRTDDGYLLVPNAANWPAVVDAVNASAALLGRSPQVVPRPELAVIAVQGPSSVPLVEGILPGTEALEYMHMGPFMFGAETVLVARSGYTGERGYEVYVPAPAATALWDELLDRGRPLGAVPAGLGARDTLRLEMGYPLHGNDISTETTPFEARLGWAVAMGKPAFRGREVLAVEGASRPSRRLSGLVAGERAIPRHGMSVLRGEDVVGEVTSGTLSPTRRQGIALAYLASGTTAPGTELAIDVRGRRGSVVVTRPPFVAASPA